MRRISFQQFVIASGMIAFVMLGLLLSGSVLAQTAIEQPRLTPGGFGDGAVQSTRDAASANVQATAEAVQDNAQATADAASANVQATATAFTDNIPLTATALVARAELRVEDIEATLDAVRTAVPDQIQQLVDEELDAYLDELGLSDNLSVDVGEDELAVTYIVGEAEFNEALSLALSASGYAYTDVAGDFTPDGVLITIEGMQITENLSGRVLALVSLAAVDGNARATVIFVTVNDVNVPQEQVDQINAAIQSAADTALDSALGAVEYSVDALFTTDTTLVTSISVPFSVEIPAQ